MLNNGNDLVNKITTDITLELETGTRPIMLCADAYQLIYFHHFVMISKRPLLVTKNSVEKHGKKNFDEPFESIIIIISYLTY